MLQSSLMACSARVLDNDATVGSRSTNNCVRAIRPVNSWDDYYRLGNKRAALDSRTILVGANAYSGGYHLLSCNHRTAERR